MSSLQWENSTSFASNLNFTNQQISSPSSFASSLNFLASAVAVGATMGKETIEIRVGRPLHKYEAAMKCWLRVCERLQCGAATDGAWSNGCPNSINSRPATNSWSNIQMYEYYSIYLSSLSWNTLQNGMDYWQEVEI